ncbi:YxiF family protein [Halobacillus rhizosphaerae]
MDFIIIESNLNFGLCVERWEYDTFIYWGLLN